MRVKFRGYDIPLTLNFGRRVGTAHVISVAGDTVTMTLDASPEVIAVITELAHLNPLREVSLVIRELRPENPVKRQ